MRGNEERRVVKVRGGKYEKWETMEGGEVRGNNGSGSKGVRRSKGSESRIRK